MQRIHIGRRRKMLRNPKPVQDQREKGLLLRQARLLHHKQQGMRGRHHRIHRKRRDQMSE